MNPFGTIAPPPGVASFGGGLGGLPAFLNVIFKTLIIIAGYTFLSGAGDPKKIQDSWAKIWQSIIGLTVAAGSFVLAALLGLLLFRDSNAILQLRIFGP